MIKPSPIHGNGLYSMGKILKNTKIVPYLGEEMTLRQFKEQYGEYKTNSLNTYLMKRINRIIVAKHRPDNLVNYINESQNPNCILKKRALYSIMDIMPETELTLKYPKNYFREYQLN